MGRGGGRGGKEGVGAGVKERAGHQGMRAIEARAGQEDKRGQSKRQQLKKGHDRRAEQGRADGQQARAGDSELTNTASQF